MSRAGCNSLLLILFVLTLHFDAYAQQTRPATLTLTEAVALAESQNPNVRNASLEVGKLNDRVTASRTQRLPNLQANLLPSILLTPVKFDFPVGAFGSYPGIGPVPAERTFITTPRRLETYIASSVNQPLTQIYRINLGIRLQELSREVAEQELRLQRQSTIANVKQLYYQIIQAEAASTASDESLSLLRELDRITSKYMEERTALKADGLRVKSKLAQEEFQNAALRNSMRSLKEQLNVMLGRDLRIDFSVESVAPPAPIDSDLVIAQTRALESRPEIKQARLRLQQAEIDRRLAKSSYIPDVTFSVTYLSFFNVELLPQNVATAGLSLKWEPFDWGRRQHELAEKQKTIEQARNAVRDAENRVLADINHRFRKLQEAILQLRSAEIACEANREGVRVALSRYQQQAGLLKEVLASQAEASGANAFYAQALAEFWTAKAEYEKAVGED